MPNAPHVAIAILNYNGQKHLEQYLPSVVTNCPDYASIWVIDNKSTDNSVTWLKSSFPVVNVIINNWNGGFAAGYNEGLASIVADYYFIVNSDVEVTAGFLDPLLNVMQQNPKLAFCQPKILSWQNRNQLEYAGAGGGLMDILGYPFCRGRIFEKVENDNGQYNDNHLVFWASGAAMLARASAFKSLGGFYEYFFMHNEEIDLCWRAANEGWLIGYNGASTVYHLGGGSLSKENPAKTYYNFRNNLVMLIRNMAVSQLLWVMPVRLALDMVAALKFATSGQTASAAAVIKAWASFLGWIIRKNKNKWPAKRGLTGHGIFKGSIVWMHFAKGKNAINIDE